MAEFAENCGLSSSALGEKATMPSDETDGKGQCEVSVSNGDCGLPSDMVVSAIPDSEGLETANTSVLDAKSGIPRRTSIIKVSHTFIKASEQNESKGNVCVTFSWPQNWQFCQ